MNLATHYLEQIKGVEIFPVISLIIFLVIFAGVVVYTIRADKDLMIKMKNLPLEEEKNSNNEIQ